MWMGGKNWSKEEPNTKNKEGKEKVEKEEKTPEEIVWEAETEYCGLKLWKGCWKWKSVKANCCSKCLIPWEGVDGSVIGFKQKAFLKCRRENPAWISGRFNEHISQKDTMAGFDHTMIWTIKINSGLSQSTESIKQPPWRRREPGCHGKHCGSCHW